MDPRDDSEDSIDKISHLLGVAGEGEKGTMSDTWISDGKQMSKWMVAQEDRTQVYTGEMPGVKIQIQRNVSRKLGINEPRRREKVRGRGSIWSEA